MTPYRSISKYTVLLWALIIGLLIPLFNNNYIYNMPLHYDKAISIFSLLIVINVIAARFSGYNPTGKYNIINFAITYPVVEEIIFRGLILPNIEPLFGSNTLLEVLYMPVTIPVIITAILFAICHLQYYKLSAQSMRFMILAFLGGILLGAITVMTKSILLSLILHIVFNSFSILFSKKIIKI
ncbi:CPBP family intramembrane metalloprotease [Paenibacillus sp. CAU 1523]|uniref:CPBP family intramembrane metalloprotease n=2 Tax=Paenibacillus arenosi TaxID=2774142 RepID=A0ABR9AT20_9BACL|nr:CPBP family intramembrane metalloprotease [Paenibacillus arenosi]